MRKMRHHQASKSILRMKRFVNIPTNINLINTQRSTRLHQIRLTPHPTSRKIQTISRLRVRKHVQTMKRTQLTSQTSKSWTAQKPTRKSPKDRPKTKKKTRPLRPSKNDRKRYTENTSFLGHVILFFKTSLLVHPRVNK